MKIGNVTVERGERKRIELEIAKLYDYTDMTMPVEVIRGKEDGPILFVSAAMHGDEINGVEIARRLLGQKILKKIKGTLIVVPVINVFGYNSKSRYLPDRRDLNRSFPGSPSGSLASRLANIFLTEIVDKCTHGIDLHTAAVHRRNLPQIRASLRVSETLRLAKAFGVPVVLNSKIREGSLRAAFVERDIRLLVYEAGEALRFNDDAIKSGLIGVLSVMKNIGMIDELDFKPRRLKESYVANSSYWVRAKESGALITTKKLGSKIKANELIGRISDPFGIHISKIYSEKAGILIGKTTIPLVNEGDALFHIASFDDNSAVRDSVQSFEDFVDQHPESDILVE
jgi:hypothetical protein